MKWELKEEVVLYKEVYLKYKNQIKKEKKMISMRIIEEETQRHPKLIHSAATNKMRLENMANYDLGIGSLSNAAKQTMMIIDSKEYK